MDALDLCVLICGMRAGVLRRDPRGNLTFHYDSSYQGVPLSLSMPVSNRIYPDQTIRPYLLGLLPDSEEQRLAIAREYEERANDPAGLLKHIGLDCPGAVQVCDENRVEETQSRVATCRALTEHEIAERLRVIRMDDDATWMGSSERWSLGGNQGKFALAWQGSKWCECLGSMPTTHIFKNGVSGFRLEALNEFVCMRTAALLGLPTAHVDYRLFEDEPAIIVRRYDRVRSDNQILRLHQEDMCQALGVPPQRKYTADGGPSVGDIVSLLKSFANARENVLLFTKMLFFNCAIAAPDAHAKNYSILLGKAGEALLAPLYDVASGLAYDSMRRRGRMAMSIGGENRFGRVGSGAIRRFETTVDPGPLGLNAGFASSIMGELASRVPECLRVVFDESIDMGVPDIEELRARMEGPVAENCRMLAALL